MIIRSKVVTDDYGNEYVMCIDCRCTILFCICSWRKK